MVISKQETACVYTLTIQELYLLTGSVLFLTWWETREIFLDLFDLLELYNTHVQIKEKFEVHKKHLSCKN